VKRCICSSRSRIIPISVWPIPISADTPHFLQLAPELGQRISPSFFQRACIQFSSALSASCEPSQPRNARVVYMRHFTHFFALVWIRASRLGRLGRCAEHVIKSAPGISIAALRGTGTGEILGPRMQRSIPRLSNLPLSELAAESCR
jgi:hypothetical protein